MRIRKPKMRQKQKTKQKLQLHTLVFSIFLSVCITLSAAGWSSAAVFGNACLTTSASSGGTSVPADVRTAAALQMSVQPDMQTVEMPIEVPYLTCDDTGQNWRSETAQCTLFTQDTAVLEAGWYAVSGEIETAGGVTVNGEVHLILADGCRLKTGGIHVSGTGNSIRIYAQSDGGQMGILETNGAADAAGIGGDSGESNGSITVYGGRVTAQGGENAAGIGGGTGGDGSFITIHGGDVTAKAAEGDEEHTEYSGGAGIGGGSRGNGSNITINGGTVTAQGAGGYTSSVDGQQKITNGGGAGIGGGNRGEGTNIRINGGMVNALGAESGGAGIGGGTYARGSSITVNDGTVKAEGGGAGIGGGGCIADEELSGVGENITINGGTVIASSSTSGSGAGIGGWGDGRNIVINGGTVTAKGGRDSCGAGIGGSDRASADQIVINGGYVTAIGGDNPYRQGGAGIGGGAVSGDTTDPVGTILINGGIVKATGGSGAGIGGGSGGSVQNISIKDAVVFADVSSTGTGTTDAIGNGQGSTDASLQITQTNCMVFRGTEGSVFQTFAYDERFDAEKFEIPSGKELKINEGGRLEIGSGRTLVNAGTVTNNGELVLGNKNCLEGSGILQGSGLFLFAIANENFLQDDLCSVYNSTDQINGIFSGVKSMVDNFRLDFCSQTFGMRPGNYTKLPAVMKDAGEYEISCDGGLLIFTVKKAPLKAVSAAAANASKQYDGSERIRIRSVTLSGVYAGDTVMVNTDNLFGSLDSSQVGVYQSVKLDAMELTGKDAHNYAVPSNGNAGLESEGTTLESEFQIIPQDTSGSYVPGGNAAGSYVPGGSAAGSYVPDQNRKPFLKDVPSKSGWPRIRQEAEQTVSGGLLAVDMNGTSDVPKEMLQTVKDRNLLLNLHMEKDIVWEIRGQDMTAKPAVGMNVAVSCKKGSIPFELSTAVLASAAGKPAFGIQMKHTGTFGFPLTLAVQIGMENEGLYANLYRTDRKDSAYQYIGTGKVSADGTARLKITDADEYVLILDYRTHMPSKDDKPDETVYEAHVQPDGTIRITAADGSAVTNRMVKVKDGILYYADAEGLAAQNRIVTAENRKYYAKKDGVIAKAEFCKTPKGSLLYAQEDGTLAVNRVVTADGRKYYAKANCAIAKGGFFVTQKGSIVYARSSGELVTGKIFRAGGKLYYAKPSGAVAENGFYSTPSGEKVYAASSGKLAADGIFRVRGKMFYADKKGRVLKNRWIRVKGKKYYCGPSYRITKTKK